LAASVAAEKTAARANAPAMGKCLHTGFIVSPFKKF
jgi:hypothetical protein